MPNQTITTQPNKNNKKVENGNKPKTNNTTKARYNCKKVR